MSALVMGAVFNRGPEEEALVSTLLAIGNAADDWGFACPSIEDIAWSIRRDEKTARLRIAKLEAAGWLKVERNITRGGRGHVYFVNVERLGIQPHQRRQRSPLWSEISSLMRRVKAETGGRPRGLRRLPFGEPDLLERAASGELFPHDKVHGQPESKGSGPSRGDGGKAVD